MVSGMKKGLIILGVILLILGLVAIIHPNFTYKKKEQVMKVGPIETNVEHSDSIQVPMGVSILLLIAGLGIVVMGSQIKK